MREFNEASWVDQVDGEDSSKITLLERLLDLQEIRLLELEIRVSQLETCFRGGS